MIIRESDRSAVLTKQVLGYERRIAVLVKENDKLKEEILRLKRLVKLYENE